MIKPLLLAAAALAALLAGPGQALPGRAELQTAAAEPSDKRNWLGVAARTPRGHLLGNPEAKTQLIEFVSYTCGHCANFAREGEPALELALLAQGKIGLEVRPVIRNALDLTASLLAQCGEPAGFKERHRALMFAQDQWLGKAKSAPQSQQAVWARGDKASRMNAASALGLIDLIVQRGQSIAVINACVMDDAAAKALLVNGAANAEEFGVNATPSFAVDGKLLDGVHGWATLYPVLSARFAPAPEPRLGEPG